MPRESFFMMTTPRKAHLRRLTTEANSLITTKYIAGQREHGGDLWKKPGILLMAIEEAVDQLVYLLTLKEQMHGDHKRRQGRSAQRRTRPANKGSRLAQQARRR